jgi:hypothetical protein
MNNDYPFILYKNNKTEFMNKVCALCLTALYYPETGNTMTKCLRLGCTHTFHQECLDQLFVKNHVNCPECREPITSTINVEKSLELTIRNDAFDHGDVDADLLEQFKRSSMVVKDYPYHKTVFERWRNHQKKIP